MQKVKVDPGEIMELVYRLAEVINDRQPRPTVLIAALEMMIVGGLAAARVTMQLDLTDDVLASIKKGVQETIANAEAIRTTRRPRYHAPTPRRPGPRRYQGGQGR